MNGHTVTRNPPWSREVTLQRQTRLSSRVTWVCIKNNNLLSDDEIDMVVTLRMNRDFIHHIRLYYPEVINSTHPTYGSIVSVQDLLDQNTTNHVDDEDLY